MGYDSIAWFPLCAGLTVLGLVLSFIAGRRRGRLSMLRGAAWSLLPVAAYLTGSVEMFWKIGAAIGHYADGFAFSPVKWAGIAVAGLAALLFAATSGRARRRTARLAQRTARARGPRDAAAPGTAPGAVTPGATRELDVTGLLGQTPAKPDRKPSQAAKPQKASGPAADDKDDLKDIEDILRKRGI